MDYERHYKITSMAFPDDYEGKVKATLLELPAAGKSAAAVLYIHGYLDYYFQHHMGEYFAARGKNFYAVDLRKCGRSRMPHQRFNYCRRLEEYYPDIDASIDIIISRGNTDITLIGHSTGGLLSALYCTEGSRRAFVNRLILNSPFLEFNAARIVRTAVLPVAAAAGGLFRHAHIPGMLPKNYFRSIHTSQKGEWDFDTRHKPEQLPPLYLAWIRAIRSAHKRVKKGLHIPIPVLVMFSDKSTYHKKWHEKALESDTILNVRDILRLGAQLGDNVTLEEVPGGLHDLVLSRRETREAALAGMDYFMTELKGFE